MLTSSRSRAALDFFRWSLERGAGSAATLGVPLPPAVVQRVREYWKTRL
jgi:hypothetical protein